MNRLVLLGVVVMSASAYGQITEADHTFARSGNANQVASWSKPSRTVKESPGFVGGGSLGGDRTRGPNEGVFGFDYVGHGWKPGRVFLGWSSSGGKAGGPYKTDGPRVFDIFSIRPVRKALHPEEDKK